MTTHHHRAHEPHQAAAALPSILRLSAAGRLAASAVLIALLWGAVWWAMS